MKLLIKGGTIINHDQRLKADILVSNSSVVKVSPQIHAKADEVIEAKGKYIFPGFIDMHTHLRTPGREDEETLLSGAQAAAKGGFTTILCMPNTNPPIDNYEIAFWIRKAAKNIGLIDIYPIGAITKARAGQELSEFGRLKEAGCLALSDDGDPVASALLLRRALEYAKMYDLLLISHAEEKSLSGDGVMLESYISSKWGMPAISAAAESVAVAKEIEIAYFTQARLHFAHISRKRSLQLIKHAKRDKIAITCETCPHYFALSIEDVEKSFFNANFKVNPPLGSKADKEAVRQALKEGTIDCIATDHAPHSFLEKEYSFQEASFGMIGLEFAFSLACSLVEEKILSLEMLADKLSYRPAEILGLDEQGEIKEGKRADLVIADLGKKWKVEKDAILSRSQNTPFLGKTLKGQVEYTICKGKIVYRKK